MDGVLKGGEEEERVVENCGQPSQSDPKGLAEAGLAKVGFDLPVIPPPPSPLLSSKPFTFTFVWLTFFLEVSLGVSGCREGAKGGGGMRSGWEGGRFGMRFEEEGGPESPPPSLHPRVEIRGPSLGERREGSC